MIKIKNSALATAAEKDMDEFLQVFIDAYLEAIGNELNEKTMPLLNGNQHTLLAWHFFSSEMRDGGFVQLIQNGYGGYIFWNPFAKAMKQFGAIELSRLIYKAKEIYDPNKKTLERETTDEGEVWSSLTLLALQKPVNKQCHLSLAIVSKRGYCVPGIINSIIAGVLNEFI